jgi:hypothetical protein
LPLRRGNKSLPAFVTTPLRRFRQPRIANWDAAMPMLLGSTTVICTLISMMLGQINMGMETIGVLLAAGVLMSVQRE